MIGIIYIGDLKYCPYFTIYTNVLDKLNKDYEVLYWSREVEEPKEIKHVPFRYYSKLTDPFYKKTIGLYKFRKWIKNKIKEKKYDKLIILSTLTGMIIFDTLLTKYKGKYIFDIRDYSYEHVSFFKKVETKIIRNSFFTGISSKAFMNFLPNINKYNIIHNITTEDIITNKLIIKGKAPLNIVWMGSIRYFDHQQKIIDHLANDERFKMTYHGNGPELEEFQEYVTNKKINNIIFTGEYNNKNKAKLLNDADILNNSYHTKKEMETLYAISNKFYDGIFYKIPQLVEINTYKANLVEKFEIGFSLDPLNKNFSDELYKRYSEMSEEKFNYNANQLVKQTKLENSQYNKQIEKFIIK